MRQGDRIWVKMYLTMEELEYYLDEMNMSDFRWRTIKKVIKNYYDNTGLMLNLNSDAGDASSGLFRSLFYLEYDKDLKITSKQLLEDLENYEK